MSLTSWFFSKINPTAEFKNGFTYIVKDFDKLIEFLDFQQDIEYLAQLKKENATVLLLCHEKTSKGGFAFFHVESAHAVKIENQRAGRIKTQPLSNAKPEDLGLLATDTKELTRKQMYNLSAGKLPKVTVKTILHPTAIKEKPAEQKYF